MIKNLSQKEYNKLYYEATKKIETEEHRKKRLDKLKLNYINKNLNLDPNWKPKNKSWNFKIEYTTNQGV
jgi:hypothetical protein